MQVDMTNRSNANGQVLSETRIEWNLPVTFMDTQINSRRLALSFCFDQNLICSQH